MAKKKQFQKPIELDDSEIFVDTEAELAKEEFERSKELGVEKQVFNIPMHNTFLITIRKQYDNHRDYMCDMYQLDKNKPIGIDSETNAVYNFDFKERTAGQTLPEYIESLGDHSWTNFCNYDVIMESNNETLKEYILSY